MAGSVNKVILVGNLGKDPEVRHTQDGKAIVNLSLATSENWRDKATGERKERTEWHRVVIFNENLAKVAEQYLKKGCDGLYRRRTADAEMDRQGRGREIFDRSGLAEFPGRIDHAGRPGRRCRRGLPAQAAMILASPAPWTGPAAAAGKAQSFARDLDDEVPF